MAAAQGIQDWLGSDRHCQECRGDALSALLWFVELAMRNESQVPKVRQRCPPLEIWNRCVVGEAWSTGGLEGKVP